MQKKSSATTTPAKKKAKSSTTSSKQPLNDFFWMREDAEALISEIIQKKELTERNMFGFVNFDQWETYLELIWSIVLLSFSSFLFKWSDVYVWVAPVVLAASASLILTTLIFSIYKHGQIQSAAKKNKEYVRRLLNANICGFIWLFWCTHSTLMKQLPESIRLSFYLSYSMGIGAFCIVIATYQNQFLESSWKKTSLALVATMGLLLFPHDDSINFELNGIVYLLKIMGFFAIYITTEFELQLANLVENGIYSMTRLSEDRSNESNFSHKFLFQLKRIELVIIRTSWILFAPSYLLVLCAVQIYPLYKQLNVSFKIYKSFRSSLKRKDPKNRFSEDIEEDTDFRKVRKTKPETYSSDEQDNKTVTKKKKIVTSNDTNVKEMQSTQQHKPKLKKKRIEESSSPSSSEEDKLPTKLKRKTKTPALPMQMNIDFTKPLPNPSQRMKFASIQQPLVPKKEFVVQKSKPAPPVVEKRQIDFEFPSSSEESINDIPLKSETTVSNKQTEITVPEQEDAKEK
jgi:hypothetical protein